MKEDFSIDGLEDFLKDASDELRMHPSERVWQGVRTKLHPQPKWPYISAGIGIFGLGLVTGLLLNGGITSNDPSAASPKTTASIDSKRIQPSDATTFSRLSQSLSATDADPKALPLDGRNQWDGGWSALPLRTKPVRLSMLEASSVSNSFNASNASVLQSIPFTQPLADTWLTGEQIPTSPVKAQKATANSTSTRMSRPASTASKASTTTERILNSIGKMGRKTSLQLYISPSVSYRSLIGQASRSVYSYTNGFAYSANFGFPTDVNDAVTHKPGLGLEAGASLQYPLTRSLRIKTGFQLNLTNYDIEAYSYAPELAPFSAARGAGAAPAIQSVSYFRNSNGLSRTWLRNSHIMMSMPIGLEYTVAGNRKISFTVASTIQPTYMLRNKAYLISTNLKNYAEEPALYKKWNLNAGAEAYLSMNTGSYRWVMGPQIRYQLLSSYKQDYPIQEHLVDFGFKIGIQKTIQ